MLKKIHKKGGFTLIEMLIVLIIMWILLMATMVLSWDQIQKIKDKTVKESILAEMQSRYSRNLWSSSFWWIIYHNMDVEISSWVNEIIFWYYTWNSSSPFFVNNFLGNFEIKYITLNYNNENTPNPESTGNITLHYTPYNISCMIWEWWELYNNAVIITHVNNSRYYCFEIKQKNCRLIELSEEKCSILKDKAGLD